MQYSLDLNFAEFEFDWDKNAVFVRILGEDGVALLHAEWSLDELNRGLPGSQVQEKGLSCCRKGLRRAWAAEKSMDLCKLPWRCASLSPPSRPDSHVPNAHCHAAGANDCGSCGVHNGHYTHFPNRKEVTYSHLSALKAACRLV